MDRKQFIKAGLAFSLTGLVPFASRAQARWPQSPVKLVVPFAAGGTTDAVARLVGARLGELLSQPVVIDNRAGAGGAIGADAVAKAPKDGYTLGIATVSTHAIAPAIAKALPYRADQDFSPIGLIATTPIAIFVHPSLGATNLADLRRILKEKPGQYNFGSPGNGSLGHLAGVWFNQLMGTELKHVPYRSSTPALQDLLAGRVHVMFENIPTPLPHVRAGSLRAVAVMAPERVAVLPDVPTTAEAGASEFQALTWTMLMAPAGSPAEVVTAANQALNQALKDEKLRTKLAEVSVDARGGTAEQAATYLRAEISKWGGLAKKSGAVFD
ncbi:Bug family tripartite tricarboxylate transporter substrate binding protein [Ramlibacter sp. Leaf400]|uniref:Bug family tripartite tricarboxylate transporter substrate binding protein n=1 Tax=Ramlibacter sp. Leaf400 TaxID=1736365 RepID=UPI0006F3F1C4|nr:tripartite tricarboxylate transporter substrate binding protein [Ramlibacter sp. Leaf400]KQT13109.1 hypothetical protein ASG30_20745 [Ramlibacter sp. Leaf400]